MELTAKQKKQQLKLKTAKRDQYKRYTRSAGGNVLYTLFLLIFGLYSVLPMIVSLLGACGLRILWIYTVFTKIPTLECLYASYPISWTVTTIAHLICIFFIFRKVSQRLSSAKLA